MHDEMQPQDEFNPGSQMLPSGEPDHEGAMARADLYKLANYSVKLFKKLNDQDQLEGWVQAKITKAADYIASVYHYLEYEMKFSEYGQALDNSDVLSESQKMALKNKLMEAKEKVKELKKAQAEKLKGKDKKIDEEKSSTGGEIDRSKKGVTKHTQNPNRFTDEPHTEPKSQAKSRSAAEKKGDAAADKAEEKEGKNWEKRFGKGSVTRVKDGKKVDEGAKPDFLDMDKDGDKKEPMKKAVADKKKGAVGKKTEKKVSESAKCNHTAKGEKCPVHGLKECGSMYEGAKPDYIDLDKDGNKKEPMKKAAKDAKSKVKEAVKKAKKAIEEGSIQNGVWVATPDKGVPPPSDPDGGSAPAPKKPAAKKPAAPAKPGVKKAEGEPADTQTALAESKELSHIKMLAGL